MNADADNCFSTAKDANEGRTEQFTAAGVRPKSSIINHKSSIQRLPVVTALPARILNEVRLRRAQP
jgi:hypothetical protein